MFGEPVDYLVWKLTLDKKYFELSQIGGAHNNAIIPYEIISLLYIHNIA